MAAPTINIDGMKFELQEGFADGYQNAIAPVKGLTKVTHHYAYQWQGGEFKPLRLALDLAVGAQSIIETPEHLKSICGKFYQIALKPKGAPRPREISVAVGTWFKRNGYIKNLDIEYKAPWSQDGQPMVATIRFEFVIDFDADNDLNKLPTSKSFSFLN